MDTLMQDIRFAFRTLAKSPLFTTLCVVCLSVGIGVNANIYSAVYAAFQRPLPYADPDRLVILYDRHEKRGWNTQSRAYETFRDIQRQTDAFEQTAAIAFRSITLTDGTEPIRLQGELISWNLFPMLGVKPHLGRVFRPDEDAPGAAGPVMLGYGVWERRYGSDSSIIGRTVPVNGVPSTIVGIMPKGFMFPWREEAWVPMTPRLVGRSRDIREVSVFGRLKPGVSAATATAELQGFSTRLEKLFPKELESWRAYAKPLHDDFIPEDTRLVIATMMGAVTFVLLIACANVANLLLARATTRGREIAIRTALGAGRGRIVRQLLTESILLALIAGPIGIGIAFWLLDVVIASIPEGNLPYYFTFAIDAPVLLYTLGITILTGVIFGLAPALQAVRFDLHSSLKEGGHGTGTGRVRNRMRTALVVGEVALSMVLLVGAALFVRSFINVQRNTGGIEPANMLTMRFFMPGERYDSIRAISARVEDIVQRVEALPGVVRATASNQIPLSGGGDGGSLEIEGKPVANRADAPFISWTGVTGHWFKTLGVPVLSGRDFTEPEARDSSGVAVINETMANRFWPQESPLGRRFRLLGDSAAPWLTVIGVTRDFRPNELDNSNPIEPSFFVSYRYLPTRNTGLMIRTEREPTQLTSAVRKAIRESDPTLPVFSVMSMEEVKRFGIWSQRLFGWMFSMFGVIALVLASVGVYGVISYSVSQRTQEIGVRLALGAQPTDVIRLIVRNGAAVALSGIAIGLVGAFGVTRVIQSLLIDVSSTDALSFIGVTLFLGAVALLASYVPARRATRVDPLTALRSE
jgi:putative ABC transport system permease protein